MVWIYLICMFLLIGSLGGLLYLCYCPIKIHLQRRGILKVGLNNTINRIYIAFLILLFMFSIMMKDYRRPSKIRFEDVTEIKLPQDYKVIKDEFTSSWPDDFDLQYILDIPDNEELKLIKSIQNSFFFTIQFRNNDLISDSDLIPVKSKSAVWMKFGLTYKFRAIEKNVHYFIRYNTQTNILEYSEVSP